MAEAHDLLLRQVEKRRQEPRRAPFHPGFRAGFRDPGEGGEELRPAVRVPGEVDPVGPDDDRARLPRLGEAEREREEEGVPGRDVGDRDALPGPAAPPFRPPLNASSPLAPRLGVA